MRGTNDPYFDWLCILIGIDSRTSGRNYENLARSLHSVEFRAKIPADKNRSMDGMQLRVDFMQSHGPYGSSSNRGPCTMLEFFVAMAKRMSFLMNGNYSRHRTEYYFWTIMDNLRLTKLSDDKWEYLNGDFFIEDAMWRVINRQFDYNGAGGIFPLKNPREDQRDVEFWYQMQAWLGENCEIDLSI